MKYEYRFLTEGDFPDIYRTFLEAFSDYAIDASYMTEKKMLNRAKKNGVDFASSIGIYADGVMAGFTLVGIDEWLGVPSAYDIVTGIVKPHRGKGIAREMFDRVVPEIKERGVRKFLLEVLQVNDAAIKAYSKTGFEIVRAFDCYDLKPETAQFDENCGPPAEIQPAGKDELALCEKFLDWHPSWENCFASIRRIPDEVLLFSAGCEDERAGLLVFYPALNWIMCIAVDRPFRRKGIATKLVKHLVESGISGGTNIKIVNVESTDSGMAEFLRGIGFRHYISQYEMELAL